MRSDDTTTRKPDSGPPQSASPWAVRVLYTGGAVESPPRVRLLEPGSTTLVGRTVPPSAGVSLDRDHCASRTHAVLRLVEGGTPEIEDLGSSNGTSVNGTTVQQAVLSDGDVVRVGDSFLLVRSEVAPATHPELGLRGASPAMERVRKAIALLGPSDLTVMLYGETGTGKEVAARALHAASGRTGPFLAVNCSAIPTELAESQLFGHVAGAFTGARQGHQGVFQAASGGTLLLDEIGDMPPNVQPKLLRVLEERTVTPVGSVEAVPVDVRVVAATLHDLEESVGGSGFRKDLRARLEQAVVPMPPLRERREDVLELFLDALGRTPGLAPDLVEALLLHDWPYNVREVVSMARELAVRVADAPVLELRHLAERFGKPLARPPSPPPAVEERPATPPSGAPTREEVVALLRRHKGIVADVVRETGRSRTQVYRWVKRYDLDLSEYRA